MKQLVTIALLGLASTTSFGQTPLTKGKGLLTGSIGYHYQSYGNQNSLSVFNFSPSIGVFVADNLVLGANLVIQTTSQSQYVYSPIGSPSSSEFTSTAFAVGPFARYYHFVGGDKFAFFGQGGLGYLRARDVGFGNANQGYLSLTPGITFFPISRFGIEGSLRGLSFTTDFNNTSVLDLGISLQDIQLGAVYYFGK